MPELRNARRERFAQEFVKDLNQTQAAIRAGYSAKTARVKGSQLMGFSDVAARVAELPTFDGILAIAYAAKLKLHRSHPPS